MSKRLTEQDIENILSGLENGDISEDEESIGDENDLDYYSNVQDLIQDLEEAEEDQYNANPDLPTEEDHLPDEFSVPGPSLSHPLSSIIGAAAWRQRSRQLIWKKGNLEFSEDRIRFTGNTDLSPEIAQLERPFQYFTLFFNDDILVKIVNETNLYITQKGISNCPPVNVTEIRQFLGIIIFMSVYHFPNVRSYWGKYGFKYIMETMTLNRFEKLRSVIHFNDNSLHKPVGHPNHDRLHKIRPVEAHLNKLFLSVAPFEQRLSLDEQMCSTKVAHFMKQYLPNKPHKWGFKLYVLCSLSGYAHNFEIYSGKQDIQNFGDEPDLGVVGNTVIRLCRSVPRRMNHIIYFDNFYSSIPLLYYLHTQGIYALGTIQRNRLGKTCKLPVVKEFMKDSVPRGSYEELVADYEGVDISVTCWKDNKPVTLVSTYVGSQPAETVSRFDKKQKKKVSVACPKIVKDYNAHMGGVDLMDSFLGRYKIRIKSRKWYIRLFYHMIDMAIINSWVLYKKHHPNMTLGDYRSDLADTLCNYKKNTEPKRGRPSSSNIHREIEAKRHRGPMKPVPPTDVRTDGLGHNEKRCTSKNRCKLPGCKGFSRTECTKCKVALCHTKNRNCFAVFHSK